MRRRERTAARRDAQAIEGLDYLMEQWAKLAGNVSPLPYWVGVLTRECAR